MPETAFRALVALELRRAAFTLRRTLMLAAGAVAALWILGWASSGRLAFVLVALGITMLMAPVMSVVKDKLDGGLEFLVSLPADRRVLAGARLLAAGLISVPGGVCCAVAFWLVSRVVLAAAPGASLPLSLLGVITGGTVLFVGLGIGVSLRMRASHFANLVFAGLLAVLAAGKVLQSLFPGGKTAVLHMLGEPWVPPAFSVGLALGALGVGWFSYWLSRTGLERFRPERDQPSW